MANSSTPLAGLMAAAGRSMEASDRFRELAMAPKLDRASLRRCVGHSLGLALGC